MTIQIARIGSRIAQHRSIYVTELSVNGCERRHRVPFAEREHILPSPGWVGYFEIQKSAIVERHQRYHGREGAPSVDALIHRVAALLEIKDANVGIFDQEQ